MIYINKSSGWGMSEQRIKRLEKIGFEWVLSGGRNIYAHTGRTSAAITHEWDTLYSRLEEYQQLYGDANVPKHFDEDLVLGEWVDRQKYGYQKYMWKKKKEKEKKESSDDNDGGGGEDGEEIKEYSNHDNCKGMTEERYLLLKRIGFDDIVGSEDINFDDCDDDKDNKDESNESDMELSQEIEEMIRSNQQAKKKEDTETSKQHCNGSLSSSRKRNVVLPNNMMKYGHTRSKLLTKQPKISKTKLDGEGSFDDESDNNEVEEEIEENEDTIFADAVAKCGEDANLDSIAEIILNKYIAKKDVSR